MSGPHTHGNQLSFKAFEQAYAQRRPEDTVLYRAVASSYKTFLALAEMEGKTLPKQVIEEFEAFLRCGILAHGFLRLKCDECNAERLVAFSCKKRGFCSSCGAKRMSECAAHLVDHVFPKVGVRQWVLSFPMPIRFILARHSKHQTKCLTIVHRAITAFIRQKAKQKGFRSKLHPGAVTLIQRFGGSLNLNLHFHMLFLEGGYYETESQGPKYWWVDPPTDAEVGELVKLIAFRVIRYLKKQGYFQDDVDAGVPEQDSQQEELLPDLQAASVSSRIAIGERKGQKVRRLGALTFADIQAELTGNQCAQAAGFSLHAAVYCPPWARAKLEKLVRYVARPAVAEERLTLKPSGDIVLKLKNPYSDGTSHLLFSGVEFVEKLAALVPQPRIHLTRFHGCLAPHSKLRSKIVPEPQTPEPKVDGEVATPPKPKKKKLGWADLLARTFNIDTKHCTECGSEMKIIAAILEAKAIRKILTHLKIPDIPPVIAPARIPTQMRLH